MNLKYILIVVILAFIVGGGILAWQYWWVPKEEISVPTIDETANWKTYSNEEYGFEFKYPSTYNLREVGNTIQLFTSSDTSGQSLISFDGQQSTVTLDSFVNDEVSGKAFGEATKTTIGGLTAYEGVAYGIVNSYGVITKSGSNIVVITFNTGNLDGLTKNKVALTKVQKQILSTFQFTK